LQLVAGYMGFSGILGHEFVGIAESGPLTDQRVVGEINCICNDCDMCSRGLGNHCSNRSVIGILNHDGAFADYLIVPEQNLHAVPDEMSDDLATLVEPIAAALQILEQVDLSSDTRVIVVGDGRLGNLCAQVLKNAKCNVTVVGRHEAKLRTFAALNVTTCHLDDAPTDRAADVVVDCSGSSTGLATALSFVRPRGTVVMKTTVAAEHEIALAPIVIDEITLVGSRCGPFDKAIAAITNNEFQLDGFISGRYPLERYREAFKHATLRDALKIILEIS
jgi:threonine dehydrogenase-like Zn-dependent dehydrogenase